ncbi:MAG: shikimate kinase [Candidatus Tokpelaia sp. JSC188]|nr:MAG: shikimate kinase [Candidatus Tokpelaia sp. JSC188]
MTNSLKNKMISRTTVHLKSRIAERSLIFVGLMGAGKSTIGKRVAKILDMRFCDSDHEIEAVLQMTISEIFAIHGEQKFRDLEKQIIFRLLNEGPIVLAIGGGAFMHPDTRYVIRKHGLSIWLNADLDMLIERALQKNNRPLLQTENPRAVMQKLMYQRYPVYAKADLVVQNRNSNQDDVARDVIKTAHLYLNALL